MPGRAARPAPLRRPASAPSPSPVAILVAAAVASATLAGAFPGEAAAQFRLPVPVPSGGGAGAAAPAPPAEDAPDDPAADWERRIETARKKAVEYLLSRQRLTVRVIQQNGAVADLEAEWKDVGISAAGSVRVKGRTIDNVEAVLPPGWFETDFHAGQIGGVTSLATLALLAAGVNPKTEPRLMRAIESVLYVHTRHADRPGQRGELASGCGGTYAIGLRASALEAASRAVGPADAAVLLKALARDGQRLSAGHAGGGGYHYPLQNPAARGTWDMSCTQYGILGLWAAARAGAEVPDRTWQHLNHLLLDSQVSDGGWPYIPAGPSTDTMTAAGVASLFVMMDMVHTRSRGAGRPDTTPFSANPLLMRTVLALEKGLDRFARDFRPSADGYYMYGAERIGVASGLKRFGGRDWFREGADLLMRLQAPDGSWSGAGGLGGGAVTDTSWNLIFLVYGGAPVLINKLRHGPKGEWQWNNYPRDAANLARWYGRASESHVNWQIIDLDPRREDDLYDAPILYIGGFKDPGFSDAEVDMLRRYVERGGTLLLANYGMKPDFAKAAIALGKRLYPPDKYPEWQFAPVLKDHPLLRELKATDPLVKIPLWHMGNGHRSFAFALPDDIAHVWHSNRYATRPECFELIARLRNYATDKAVSLPPKVRPSPLAGVPAHAGRPRPAVSVGSVRFSGRGIVNMLSVPAVPKEEPRPVAALADWASTPLAWRNYAEWYRRAAGGELRESRGLSLTAEGLRSHDLLHFSGHYAFGLSDSEETALKEYLLSGGTALFDCAGGSSADFGQSAAALMRKLFGPDAISKPKGDEPLFTGDGAFRDITAPEPTRQLRLIRPDLRGPEEMFRLVTVNGRIVAVICLADLSVGLSGQTSPDRVGYSVGWTRALVANLLIGLKGPPKTAAVPAAPVLDTAPARGEPPEPGAFPALPSRALRPVPLDG